MNFYRSDMLTNLQVRILSRLYPGDPGDRVGAEEFTGRSKIAVLLGPELIRQLNGKVVVDFGCGGGAEALEFARMGARRVIGIDIREDVLEIARRRAAEARLGDVCTFATKSDTKAEVIVSLDAFEHFEDPAGILEVMASLIVPGGQVIFSFGPPWYHPLGGHLFSVFPWAHLLFSEEALIRWRSRFKDDGARRFSEVAEGLNQMSIRRFEKFVAASPFFLARLEAIPIRRLAPLHNRLTREFITAAVRGCLVKR